MNRRRENQWVRRFRKRGYLATRGDGWDVWAFNKETKSVILIDVKTRKGKRNPKIKYLKEYKDVNVKTYTLSYE